MPVEHVVVVGAGPAGSATALGLVRAGIPVTVVDRAAFPRRKVCGEYLGAGALAALERLGFGRWILANGRSLAGVRVWSSGSGVELPFRRPALSLARELLDAQLLDEARRAGAALFRGRVVGVEFEDGRAAGVVLQTPSGERRSLAGRFVVGADGIGSTVARSLKLAHAPHATARFAIGGHYRTRSSRDRCIEMIVERDAYLAINPLEDGVANVMAVVHKPNVETWSGLLDFAGASRIGERVAVGPLEHATAAPVARGALLVGDAAGFLNPFTGQGVYLALRGGELAAHAIARAYASRGAETQALAEYAHAHARLLSARRRWAAFVDALVRIGPLTRLAAWRLQRSPFLAGALIDAVMGA